jgi:hypothetical protein
MTKRRPPLSIDAALARIAGQLEGGWETMATATGRKDRTVRNWGDPDTPEQIPLDCAIALDLAYQEAGGEGAPLWEAYTLKLELAEIERFADRHALGRRAVDVIRECGEAGSALVAASLPGATQAEREAALRELVEAFEVIKRTFPLLGAGQPDNHQTGPP